jgi:hypothetical protein
VQGDDLYLVQEYQGGNRPRPRGIGACTAPWGPAKRGSRALPQWWRRLGLRRR